MIENLSPNDWDDILRGHELDTVSIMSIARDVAENLFGADTAKPELIVSIASLIMTRHAALLRADAAGDDISGFKSLSDLNIYESWRS